MASPTRTLGKLRRPWRATGLAFALGLCVASAAPAAQYQVRATAGSVDDEHTAPTDAIATASFSRAPVGGIDSYGATANLAAGTLFANSSISNGAALDFGGFEPRSTARFEETLRFEQSLAGPVTVRATLTSSLLAPAPSFEPGQPAEAQAYFRFELAGCRATLTTTNGTSVDTSECPNAAQGWSADPEAVIVVIDPTTFPGVTELDLEGEVDAAFFQPTHVVSGNASASLAIAISVDPPVTYTYTGTNTAFPVPEASQDALAALAFGVLALRKRREARKHEGRAGAARPSFRTSRE